MKWDHVINPSELEENYTLFAKLKDQRYAKFVNFILKKFAVFLGYPLGIVVPFDVAQYEGDKESLRALRLLNKFREEGFISSFYSQKHYYGDEPHGQVTMASLKEIKRFGFSGKGADMFDRKATLWPAVGEAVERYAMQFYQPKDGEFIDASWKTLSEPKVDIFDVAGFDNNLRKQKHRAFKLDFDETTNFRWVKATDLLNKKSIWAPLQWFSFSHVQKHTLGENSKITDPDFVQETLLSVPITTGVAAGQNTTDAILRGLLEVIERDAFIIYWLNQIPAKKIDILSFHEERFQKLNNIANRYQLEMYALYFQTDVPAHTVCSIVIDRSGIGPALIVGAKTGLSLSDTAYGALSDTLAQRGLYRNMMDGEEYKKQNFDNIFKIGHKERMYYWFDIERLKYIETFISGKTVTSNQLPTYPQHHDKSKDLKELLKFFKEKNYSVYYKEILSDRLRNLTEGLSVTVVKIPQMQPLYLEESLRSIAGKRLYEIPDFLGYDKKSEKIDEFYKIPHPFP